MCGVLVAIDKSRKGIKESECRRALSKLKWRGPDHSFDWTWENRAFLGQTILSLTGDLTGATGEHLLSPSKRFRVIFNGEIYNYRDLAHTHLKTQIDDAMTDSQVLAHLHDKVPAEQIPNYLAGMYAFTVLDTEKQEIHFSRDVQGEKSLFIFEDNDSVIVASEIRAILALRPGLEADYDVLRDYFYTRHFMQMERTTFKGIRQLQPGRTETLDLRTFKWKTSNQLNLDAWIDPAKMEVNSKRTMEDLADELDEILRRTIGLMIPRSRGVATVVSGGIDSSLLSYYLNELTDPKVFVAVNHSGKDNISHDLKKFEKVLDKKINTLEVDAARYASEIPRCQDALAGPLFSHSFIGQSIQSEFVRSQGCKVFFGGEAADELFGGYGCYREIPFENSHVCPSPYTNWKQPIGTNGGEKIRSELETAWSRALKAYSHLEKSEQFIQAMMFCDFFYQVPTVGLRGADLMSMMWSVETRSIFVREPVVRFALNLPVWAKAPRTASALESSKVLLKKLFLRYYPKELLVEKQGFSGFPNESAKYLGKMEDFLVFDRLGFDRANFKMSREIEWKLINTEYFLRSFQ